MSKLQRTCVECGKAEAPSQRFLPMPDHTCTCTVDCYKSASHKLLIAAEKKMPRWAIRRDIN